MSLSTFLKKLFGRPTADKPTFPKPGSAAKTLYLTRETHVIRDKKSLQALADRLPGSKVSGLTWDLNGGILSGKRLRGNGDQSESQDPLLRIQLDGVTIKNGFCKDVKDGLNIDAKGVTIQSVHWLDVGEDAVNNKKGATGTRIIRCSFDASKAGNDKSMQINDGKDAEIRDCLVYGGITAIRLGDKWSQPTDTALVTGCRFVGVETALNLATIRVKVAGCSYEGVRKKVVHSHGSSLV